MTRRTTTRTTAPDGRSLAVPRGPVRDGRNSFPARAFLTRFAGKVRKRFGHLL